MNATPGLVESIPATHEELTSELNFLSQLISITLMSAEDDIARAHQSFKNGQLHEVLEVSDKYAALLSSQRRLIELLNNDDFIIEASSRTRAENALTYFVNVRSRLQEISLKSAKLISMLNL